MSSNLNLLSPIGFQFAIAEAENLSFAVQGVNLPGIQLGTSNRPTPFVQQHLPGDITFDDFSVSFKLTENMEEYFEIQRWMYKLGKPESFDQFKYTKSDCTIIIMNGSKKPAIQAKFTDCFPVDLSSIQFDLTSTDVQYVTVTATFKFLTFNFSPIV